LTFYFIGRPFYFINGLKITRILIALVLVLLLNSFLYCSRAAYSFSKETRSVKALLLGQSKTSYHKVLLYEHSIYSCDFTRRLYRPRQIPHLSVPADDHDGPAAHNLAGAGRGVERSLATALTRSCCRRRRRCRRLSRATRKRGCCFCDKRRRCRENSHGAAAAAAGRAENVGTSGGGGVGRFQHLAQQEFLLHAANDLDDWWLAAGSGSF
jgi:hypothetical protein